ncbi:alpha-1,4-glucan--maltose-1-phosphate maltosyltransferase [Actinocrinis puniceicyclus]|uniref:Alpha-1,4-glucan:maltose-1-phosphate maltosyltransferase n=1 Tax=Actinocrinis puniceicyclus TaxID=977794 RepID=A0A8J7WGI0_9ACTN|nr:alpha-1,4-glucan--maltose-1-phosphate maltosyltransferase [Actinocrinis puniceicyclus]MBS2961846.1 alpha-1,4-glucan--maltose-1-phosphate maltosyltransferase [Actinocrinis puniceicyclus]
MSIGRIPILDIQPRILDGARPVKAVPGEQFTVTATVFREGHDAVAANVVLTGPDGERGPWTPMRELTPGTDRYGAQVAADRRGEWTFHVEAWSDPLATWYHAARVKIPAGIDVELVFEEGAQLFERAAAADPVTGPAAGRPSRGGGEGHRNNTDGVEPITHMRPMSPKRSPSAPTASLGGTSAAAGSAAEAVIERVEATLGDLAGRARMNGGPAPVAAEPDSSDPEVRLLLETARLLRDVEVPAAARLAAVEEPRVHSALAARPVRDLLTESERCPLRVDRARALFGSWYEFFPRSEGAQVDPTGATPPVPGTLRTAAERLPGVADMGFDVVYLPPVHPIGTAFRKGPNNTTTAGPLDVGSPWAIGSPDGGHDAIHPDLGNFADFDHFVDRAGQLGMEVALDFALQCSPDHPWVEKHPDWFAHRADGTIAYAENPPKKYQDIYPLDFDGPGVLPAILEECERVLRLWMGHGVRIFRVDNPHTKPVLFWERLLDRIHATDPDVLFLAEAFTRPAMLHTLAKIGFHQSYTYFTWRNTKSELQDYLTELSQSSSPFLRPNLFVNTPDILHEYLQYSGRPGFKIRAVLASTLSPSWGVYAGYELCESVPVRPGSEEYLDSEKYQLRPRDWAAAQAEGRSLAPFIARLNSLRREHVALQGLRNLKFHSADNDAVLCYSKRTATDLVLVVVNLDPHNTVEATVSLDLSELGLGWDDRLTVRDELSGAVFHWGRDNYVRLDPHDQPAHLLTLIR